MQPLLTPEQRAAYLARIGLLDAGVPTPTEPGPSDVALVADLQLAHLRTVPFENLDVHLGRPIVLDPERIHAKVVDRRRGGYCYELNSQFARLLASFGFEPSLVSARVARPDGGLSDRFDHLALLVPCRTGAGEVVTHLVDVGFGDAATVPVPLIDGVERDDRDRRIRARPVGETDRGDDPAGKAGHHRPEWDYEEDRGGGWAVAYRFETTPQDLAAFARRNEWQQSSPDSHFTGQILASLLTEAGRTTLSGPVPGSAPAGGAAGGAGGNRLIVTTLAGRRTEDPIEASRVRDALQRELGLDLPGSGPALTPALDEIDEIDPAILTNPVATLATNGPDGRPQLTAVWYGIEDGALCISATAGTQKARNLRRDRRCSVLVFHPASPNLYAEIRGVATLDDDADYRFADRLGRRYATDFRSFDEPGAHRLRVVVRPTRIVVTDVR